MGHSGALASFASGAPGASGAVLDLLATLQQVADAIVESLGFEVAVINLLEPPDHAVLRVIAVAGPAEVREALLGTVQSCQVWDELLHGTSLLGRLLFLDHRNATLGEDGITWWIPDLPVSQDPDSWHPEDGLFAPLETTSGASLGLISVDLPRDGRRPGPATCNALEAFALMASLAIEHAQLSEQSRRNERRFEAVFASSPIPIGLLDPAGTFEHLNDAFCRFLDRTRSELLGTSPLAWTHPEDNVLSRPLSTRLRSGLPAPRSGEPGPVEQRYVLPDGSIVWGRLHLTALDPKGSPGVLLAQIEDITGRKRAEQRLVHQAHFDALTRLPNRVHILERIAQAVVADRRDGTLTVVFFCDLDGLKLVNDGHGHAVGDAYLTAVAQRLATSVRTHDVVGRLGGDEFVVLLSGVQTPTEAIGLAGRVLEGVQQPLQLGSVLFTPTMSVGISYGVGPSVDADRLLAEADTAMYSAKSEGRGGWHVFDPTLSGSPASQLQLRHDVGSALLRDELVLHYQPVVALPEASTCGYEALLRWQHPDLGLLQPAQFLAVVLGSEHESAITDWTIAQACHDAVRRPGPRLPVTVNVSSQQICRPDLPDVVGTALSDSGLAAGDLVLEITEDRMLASRNGPERIAALRRCGIAIALDDFGSGSAGLVPLQRFPTTDIVKLDRTFVAGLGQDQVSGHLVRAMKQFADACGLRLVAKGIETAEQAELLEELGIGFGQGFHYGRPAPLCP